MIRRDTLLAQWWALLLASLLASMLISGLAGCASPPPPATTLGLKLSPASLGQPLSVQQHLTVERNGSRNELDTALEVDDHHLELVGMVLGQRVLRLHFDGKTIESWRHLLLPSQVQADNVLDDLQLTLWPVAAIRPALPPGWRLEEQGLRRSLYLDDKLVATIEYDEQLRWNGTAVLNNVRYNYRLTIQSAQ